MNAVLQTYVFSEKYKNMCAAHFIVPTKMNNNIKIFTSL